MCNRVRQPAAEAPDDRGGRVGVREVLAQVCWFAVAASRAGRQQAGGARAALAQQGSCCCRPCRLAHDAGGRRARRAYLARKQAAGTAGGRASGVRRAVATGRRMTAGGGARCRNAKALRRKGSRREPEIGRRGNLG